MWRLYLSPLPLPPNYPFLRACVWVHAPNFGKDRVERKQRMANFSRPLNLSKLQSTKSKKKMGKLLSLFDFPSCIKYMTVYINILHNFSHIPTSGKEITCRLTKRDVNSDSMRMKNMYLSFETSITEERRKNSL